jgi:hypothetical protein
MKTASATNDIQRNYVVYLVQQAELAQEAKKLEVVVSQQDVRRTRSRGVHQEVTTRATGPSSGGLWRRKGSPWRPSRRACGHPS